MYMTLMFMSFEISGLRHHMIFFLRKTEHLTQNTEMYQSKVSVQRAT